MVSVYGSPFDRGRQVSRVLRRGMPGITAGRSESAAPVRFPRRTGNRPSGSGLPGPGGAPGQPLTDPFKRGRHLLGTVGLGAGLTFGFTGSVSRGTVTTGPVGGDPADLLGDPYTKFTSTATPGDLGSLLFIGPSVQVGQGNGRGGFLVVAQFAFKNLPATRWWFAGATVNEIQNFDAFDLSSTAQSFVGVGQGVGDTSPQFVYNDAAGTITKVSSGLPTVVTNKVYEVRVFANPRSTTAVIALESFSGRVSSGRATHTATANLPAVIMSPFQVIAANGSGGGVASAVFRNAYVAIQPTADIGLDA